MVANIVLGDQGTFISDELQTFSALQWALIWLACNDTGGAGSGTPCCSITLTNTSTTNCFGEIAFNVWPGKVGTPTDGWTLQQDPGRSNVQDMYVNHNGFSLMQFVHTNDKINIFQNMVLNGTNATGIASLNAAGTAQVNCMRMAGGDYLQVGAADSHMTGIQFYSGSNGLALQLDGTTSTANFYGQRVEGGNTPTIAAGTGAGTSPTIAITGTANAGKITLTTGTAPTASATIATVTYPHAFPNGSSIVFSPANANAAQISTTKSVYALGSTSNFVLTADTTALTASTQYIWEYIVGGY